MASLPVVINLSDNEDDAVSTITRATSISSEYHIAQKTTASPPQRAAEAARFFQQLDNYIPVGCLICQDSGNSDVKDWQECFELSSLATCLSEYLLDIVKKLLSHGWIRIFFKRVSTAHVVHRIYILPGDVGHRYVDHASKNLSKALHALIIELDVSPETWNGHLDTPEPFDPCAALDEGSLYWMFNTLKSPAPSVERVKSHFHREALEDLLDLDYQLPGLKTQLYPYQRRSAALMLQRETESRLELDPRLEQRVAPNGSMYFYGPRDAVFLRSPRYYETCKGGILAETMGLGKTLMCIALCLATVGHLPKVPTQHDIIRTRPRVGSLAEMAVASINQHSAPWKSYFAEHAARTGEHLTQCERLLRQNAPTYEIPREPIRWNRKTTSPPPKRLMLASTTIIVVPRNLFSQWKSELEKHVEVNALSILLMDDARKDLPSPQELILFDVILFSRTRFEQEDRDGSDKLGRRQARYPVSCRCPYIGATLKRDCTCLREEDLYNSPLKHIHFLRIIIDEGHFFSSPRSIAAHVANEIVTADHRWVVSGTPAKDLLGVEMDILALDAADADEEQRQDVLEQRRRFSVKEDTAGATKAIGELVTHFLKIRPWAACDDERSADWKYDIYRHEDARFKTGPIGFSRSLRRTLESIVVKTQPDDVERDIELPPLEHRIVRLKPSLYDKLTVNTFILVLTANAVTSERTDTDYLFHPNSQKERYLLVHNLRESAFVWTGFSEDDVLTSIKNSEGYLNKEGTSCSETDRALLIHCLEQARHMLTEPNGWKALSKSHEVGLFLDHWPEEFAQFWSFDGTSPMLCGAKQLLDAQTHVNEQAHSDDPTEGLAGAGLRALAILRTPTANESVKHEGHKPVKSGIPSSVMTGQPIFHKRSSSSKAEKPRSPRAADKQTQQSPQKDNAETTQQLPAASPLRKTTIIGTTSAKLSYLLSRIQELSPEEKILVFYDGDNTAYYIAQALELLHIPHLIYAKTLTNAQKSDYIVRFDKDASFRVLLMDVRQAAHGLNVSSASRVFFVNFCRPQIEAQAIKRAHRIGQRRRVVVETLLLSGTIEEEMFERARRMTRAEHSDAKMLDDDGGIKAIIQGARPLEIEEGERTGYGSVAWLERPQQLWSREGWEGWKGKSRDEGGKGRVTRTPRKRRVEGEGGGGPATSTPTKKRQKKKK